MKIQYLKLHEILPADINPKDHDIGDIYMSMKRFGFTEPPVKNEKTGKLVAGHGRLETLKILEAEDITTPPDNIKLDSDGNWLVPVIAGIEFETDAEAEAYLVASNQLTIKGGWKTSELTDLLERVVVDTEDLSGTGFDLDDIDNLINTMESKVFEDEDIAEVEDETTVRFKLGRYKFGIDADHFYDWEAKRNKDLGSNSPQDLIAWIKERLEL